MKTVIIYKTKTGSTKKYASWLADSTGAEVMTFAQAEAKGLTAFDRIIVSSGTYAGRMPLTRFLKDNWDQVKEKEIFILAVGAAPEDNWWSKISYKMIPGKIRKQVEYRKLPGEIGKSIKEDEAKAFLNKVLKDLHLH